MPFDVAKQCRGLLLKLRRMKCILDFPFKGPNFMIVVEDKKEMIELSIVRNEEKETVLLSVEDANDLSDMLRQVAIQSQMNQF